MVAIKIAPIAVRGRRMLAWVFLRRSESIRVLQAAPDEIFRVGCCCACGDRGQGAERLVHHIHRRLAAVCLGRGSPVQRRILCGLSRLEKRTQSPIRAPGLENRRRSRAGRPPRHLSERHSRSMKMLSMPGRDQSIEIADAGRLQSPGEGEARELAALVGIEDLRALSPGHGAPVERDCAEARIRVFDRRRGQDEPARRRP